MIATSVLVGRLITRIGRYKAFLLAAPLVMGFGYYLLSRLHYGSSRTDIIVAMVMVGLGLGAVLQTYMLVVQNATSREELGVATSITQLSRSLGATLGTAIFGAIMTGGLAKEIPNHLPPGRPKDRAREASPASGRSSIPARSPISRPPSRPVSAKGSPRRSTRSF